MGLGHITKVDEDCSVIEKDEEKKPALRLDLACGNNKREGFLGVDISPDTQADLIIDLNKYPWEVLRYKYLDDGKRHPPNINDLINDTNDVIRDDSVFEIHCSHFIEHVTDLKAFMEEIYRILIPGGRVTFYAPYYSSIRALQDFTHKRVISEATFLYFNKAWMDANKLQHYDVRCDFAILSTKFLFNAEYKTRAQDAQEWARKHNINAVDDIEVVLQAIKPFDKSEGDKANDAH